MLEMERGKKEEGKMERRKEGRKGKEERREGGRERDRNSGQILAAALESLVKMLLYKTNEQPTVSRAQQLCAFKY